MVVILEISTWQGISLGAIHWYGTLKYDDDSKRVVDDRGYTTSSGLVNVDLERILTPAEVKAENAQLKANGHFSMFKIGDSTTGFLTEEDCVAAAIKYFKEHFDQETSVLYRGQYASCSAWQTLLVWPASQDRIAQRMTKLATEFQSLNGYECKKKSEEYVEKLDDRWRKFYDQMNKYCSPEGKK